MYPLLLSTSFFHLSAWLMYAIYPENSGFRLEEVIQPCFECSIRVKDKTTEMMAQ